MAASYPAAAKSFTAINAGDTVTDAMWEDAYDEITAIEQALVTGGLAHNLFPDASANARTLGTSSKFWGLAYLKGVHLAAATTLTIASGVITNTQGYHAVDTEGAAGTDDLDTITAGTGIVEGAILVLRAANVAHVVTVKDGSGNLLLNGDCVLSATDRTLTLLYDGTNWREIARSVSGATGTWTPADGSGAALTFTNVEGKYFRDGDFVEVWGNVTFPATASGANVVLTGLPVAPMASAQGVFGGAVTFTNYATAITLAISSSSIVFYNFGGTLRTNANFTGVTLTFHAKYRVA